ncbi:ABC transporter permease [Saccharophagus sp. K07]|uniref:ABC transporter permease n=1 Tax=Saccharophagus sp. K07 TaxID=2283636 RepID=UPI0016522E5A|nr:ABC transporter permease [Saccharophagus sp. K07]MBC6907378.1 ABC transporter permease [Saccharophagus sp. K07]
MKQFEEWRYLLLQNPLTLIALIVFIGVVICALFAPWLVPYDPFASDTVNALQPPSANNWFGTDQLGRDIFSRVIMGARMDLGIAVGAVALAAAIGTFLGACAGFYGGHFDQAVGRGVDIIMAFPLFVLAMAIVAGLGNNVINVVYASAIINMPFYVRVVRSEILILKNAGFVEAARLCGNSNKRILWFQLLPNVSAPLVVQMSLNMGWSMLNAASLSFVGLGIRPPTPEWGIMVAEGAHYIISGQWWVALFPGLALTLVVLCFNLLGDGLRDIIDPRRRT